jgi:16S rRNA (guanine527-N7)-methyltransferase
LASRSATLEVAPTAVADVARALSADVSPAASEQLGAWLRELVRWNATHDLTAARSAGELTDLMLADAFVLARLLPRSVAVVDVGSGAGAPGLPLALLRPDLRVTLVEPLQKRLAFMRLVLAGAGRLDVTLEARRGDALARALSLGPAESAFDVALSRATLPPAEWLALAVRLVRPGGEIVALLAQDAAPERPDLEALDVHAYRWPVTDVQRTLVRYRRRN